MASGEFWAAFASFTILGGDRAVFGAEAAQIDQEAARG
jgi:hypothetical protein